MTNFMVLDLETSIGNGPHGPAAKDPTNSFYTIIYGDSPENVVIEHRVHGFGRQLPTMADRMLSKTDVLILHNAPFDLSYIWNSEGLNEFLLRDGQVWDTQIAEYLMSGQRHSFASLGELQEIYLGKKIKESRISALFKHGIGADKILAAKDRCKRLFTLYSKYSKDDGVTTLQVFEKQYAKAKSMGMLNVIKLYNRYMLALLIIQNTGIPVNLDKCQKTLRDFKLKSIDYLQQAVDIITPMWDVRLGEFNINSPKDKSAILFGGKYTLKERVEDGTFKNGNIKYKSIDSEVAICGFKVPTSVTEESKIKGRYQTGNDIIEKIYRTSKNPILIEYCHLQKLAMNYGKMCNTYLEPFLNLSINGLLYPNYNNTNMITSRISCSKPNLQNVPSKGEMLSPIQGLFEAPDGWIACSADYSQLEIYVSAYLSKDTKLTNDLLSGIDFHIKRLSYAEDLPYEEVYDKCKVKKLPEWDLKRSKAKIISYRKAYGGGISSLAKAAELPEEVVKIIFEKEDIEYPQIAIFNKSVMEDVMKSSTLSKGIHIPASKKLGGKDSKQFICGAELLPIISANGDIRFDREEYRKIGYYKCITGKRYCFEELGRDTRYGLKRGYSSTQTKNYHIQGTASDVQASSSAALIQLLLKNPDKVKMINEIHDSKWFLIKEEYLDMIIPIIRDKMENVPDNFKKFLKVEMPFKIPVDFKIGKNFAEMQPFKESIACPDENVYNKIRSNN